MTGSLRGKWELPRLRRIPSTAIDATQIDVLIGLQPGPSDDEQVTVYGPPWGCHGRISHSPVLSRVPPVAAYRMSLSQSVRDPAGFNPPLRAVLRGGGAG
jgi:hypothetical protein